MAGSSACMVVVLMLAMARTAGATPQGGCDSMLGCVRRSAALCRLRPGGRGGGPGPQCCGGLRSLLGAARTADDRRTACRCLKTVATKFSGYVSRANSIPGKCGVSIPYKLSPSINCSKIN